MHAASNIEAITSKYAALAPLMDERMRRQWAAAEARAYGRGGIQALSSIMRMSPNTVKKGLAELAELAEREKFPDRPISTRLRCEGGGRKRSVELDPALQSALE